MNVDCNKKPGRLKDLCLCKGLEGRPDPTPEKCARYAILFAQGVDKLDIGQPGPEQLLHIGTNLPVISRGLGDTIAKLARRVGVDKLAAAIASKLGKKDCGCKHRQSLLNKWFPYKGK